MANTNNETSLTQCFDQTTKDLFENLAVENGLVCREIKERNNLVKGDNYLGIVMVVEVVGRDKEDKNKMLSVIVKMASRNDVLRNQVPLEVIFCREIHLYSKVFPAFSKLEMSKDLTPSVLAPKFYNGSLEYRNETLLLENLKESCYKMQERKKTMDARHVKFVFKKYGQFHALSLALRDQNIKQFKEVAGSMNEMFIEFLRKSGFIQSIKKNAVDGFNALDEYTDIKAYNIYKNMINKFDEIFNEVEKSVDDYSVVLHGDCWTNNLMFKYEDLNDLNQPTSLCFIDFQLSRVAPPVLDLSYFFFSCCGKELLDKSKEYLKIYYESLAAHLLRLGSNPDKVYPYYKLQEHWKKYAKYGLIMCQTLIRLMLSEENEAADIVNAAESNNVAEAFSVDLADKTFYYRRVRDAILHCIENNLI